jgi:carbon storage regulator CsrA
VLVLKRNRGEEVYIDGGRIRVAVLSVAKNGAVRLGFAAPKEIVIDREEIHHLKHGTTWRLTDGSDATVEGREGGTGSGESAS